MPVVGGGPGGLPTSGSERRPSDIGLLSSRGQLAPPAPPRRLGSLLGSPKDVGGISPSDVGLGSGGIPARPARHPTDGRGTHEVEKSIIQTEKMLDQVATGPPQQRRAVTKQELAEGRAILAEARSLHLDGKDYDADRMQMDKEQLAARVLVEDAEKHRDTVREDNEKLKVDILSLQEKLKSAQTELAMRAKLVMTQERKCEDLQAEKVSLEREIEKLLEEIDVLKDNLGIQETNVDRLKELAERLQEDIARAHKRHEETQEKHRLQILRMEAEIAKDVDELNAEYAQKEEELRRMLRESQELRLKAEQDWAEREARLAKMTKEEVRAKNDELQKLRSKIELLLREQIDTMRDRVRNQTQLQSPTGAVGKARRSASRSKARGYSSGSAPRDLAVHTHEVLSELSAGRKILTVALSCRGGDFRPPVTWSGRGPVHRGDISTEDIAVQLAVDQRVLRPVPSAARPGGSSELSGLLRPGGSAPHGDSLRDEWRFATPHGSELVVGVRLLPPGAS